MMRQLMARVAVVLLLAAPALAGGTVKEALSQVPANAMGVICVPSIEQLDLGYQRMVKEVELGAPFPPSLVQALQGFMPPLAKMDQSGALMIVIMPADNLMMMNQSQGIIVPAKDPKALLEAFGGQPGEGDVWSINVMGQPFSAKALKDRVVLAQAPNVLSALSDVKKSLAARLSADELQSVEGLNLLVWLDAGQVFKLVGPMIQGMMAMSAAGQASSGGELAAQQAEMTKKQVDLLLEGLSTVGIGASINKDGLGLRFLMTINEGSELASQAKFRTTDGSLLSGLPAGDFILAGGELVHPDAAKKGAEQLDIYFAMLEDAVGDEQGVSKKAIDDLKVIVKKWLPLVTGARGSVAALPADADGVFAVSGIVGTTDSAKWLELLSEGFDKVMGIATDPNLQSVDDEAREALKAITFKKNVEEIEGIKVHHLAVDLDAIEQADEDDIEELRDVLGKEGVLFRFAAPSKTEVVVSFGGGKATMAKLIAGVKQNKADLDNEAGIKKVAKLLPQSRAAVAYLDVQQVFSAINLAMKKLDEEQLPVKVPAVSSPLAVSLTGGDRWARFDVLFPMDVVKATKSIVEQLTGSSGAVEATADSSAGS